MAGLQLVEPNLPGKGALGYCLQYARLCYGVPAKYQTAWEAWYNAEFKHADMNFPPVAVPVWFKYPLPESSPGHVVIRTPDGKFYSSPYSKSQTQGYVIFNSVAEIEQRLNARFVGWTEDINGVRVAQEGEGMDDKDILGIYEVAGRNYKSITKEDYDYYRGKKPEQLTNDLKKSLEWKAFSYNGSHPTSDNSEFVKISEIYIKKG